MSEIRSVSVHLDADVAGYIAKMRLAGAETDRAFSSSTKSIGGVNTSLSRTETELGKVDAAAQRVDRTLNRNGNGWTTYSKKVSGFLSNLSTLPGLALGATAALQPLAGAALAVGAAFAAPIAFAGGGLGLFAVLGLAGVTQTNKQLKNVDTLKKAVDSAKTSLDSATRSAGKNAATSTSVANAQIRVNQATNAYQTALKALSPAQREFAKAKDTFGTAFDRLLGGKSGATLLGPFTQGINLAADVLPKLQPILKATSDGLTTLLTDLDNFSQTKGFTSFIHDVAAQAGPDIVILGHALGDLAHGIGDLLVASGKSNGAKGILHDFGRLSQTFSDWAGSKKARDDVRGLFDYFHQIGPDVATTLGSVADAVGAVSHALKPIGPVELHVISGIADAIAGIPIPVLTALAGAATGLAVFSKVGGFKAAGLAGSYFKLLNSHGGIPGGPGGVPGVPGYGLTGGPAGGVTPVRVVGPVEVIGVGPSGPGAVPVGGVPEPRAPIPPGGGLLNGLKAASGVDFAVEGAAAAKTAAALVKTAGGDLAAQSAAAEKAFTGAIKAGEEAAAAASARAFTFGAVVGVKGLLRTLIGAPIVDGPGTTSAGSHRVPGGTSPNVGTQFVIPPSGKLPTRLPNVADIKAVGTAYDALKQHATNASRAIDEIGPHGSNAAKKAGAAVTTLNGKMASIDGGHASAALDLVGHSAQRAGQVGGSAIGGLHRAIDGLPANKTVNVKANTGQSLAQLRAVASELAAIRSKTITLTTQRVAGGRSLAGADGMTVPGSRYPYGDKVFAHLAPGEEVISNRHGQADAFRADRAAGRIPSYANGGTVGGSSPTGPGDGTSGVRGELHRLAGSLHAATKELDAERASLQNMRQARSQLVSSVQGNFRTDIFGTPGGAWGAAADPLSVLRTDIRGARKYGRTINGLRRRGLSGGVLSQIDTLAEARQVAAMSPEDLRKLERLYGERQRVSHAAGVDLGDARFGKAIAEQTQTVKAQAADVHHLTQQQHEANKRLAAIEKHTKENAAKTADGINGTAAKAMRTKRR